MAAPPCPAGRPAPRRGGRRWLWGTASGAGILVVVLAWVLASSGPRGSSGQPEVVRERGGAAREPEMSAGAGGPVLEELGRARAETRVPLAARMAEFLTVSEAEADPVAFEKFLGRWIADLEVSEVAGVLAALAEVELESKFSADVTARLVRRWSEGDAAAALAWVETQPPGEGRDLAMENVAIVRSNRDLAGARSWIEGLPAGEERNRVAAAVANEAVRTRPVEALELAADLPASRGTDELIRRAAMEWTTRDRENAVAWARGIPDEDEDFRAQVLAGVATAWADGDPVAAGEFAVKELPPGRAQADAVVGVAQRWAQRDAAAAAAWVDRFPPGDLREAAVESVAAIWAREDAGRAERWRRVAR